MGMREPFHTRQATLCTSNKTENSAPFDKLYPETGSDSMALSDQVLKTTLPVPVTNSYLNFSLTCDSLKVANFPSSVLAPEPNKPAYSLIGKRVGHLLHNSRLGFNPQHPIWSWAQPRGNLELSQVWPKEKQQQPIKNTWLLQNR